MTRSLLSLVPRRLAGRTIVASSRAGRRRLVSLAPRLVGRRVPRTGRRRAAFPVPLAAALCAALCAFGAAPPTAPPVEAGAALDAYERGDCRAA
ncbi:hypothetical protein LLG88_10715, partial [bacterium]|nr:hypothetical protein [bacterium]